ncbi:MAG TPA: 1-(5-phosphoribosyl)-5-[(5-phosphoribosylamino)methylideneamino]imidazole-4-carboxamide isomerase [Thermodesulfobacteriota bacterium]
MARFEVVPAIDVKDGRCVRLVQGRFDEATVYGDDPVAVARRWAEAGAPRLHVVDLDGAVAGRPLARDLVVAIARAVAPLPVQVGGGIRTRADLDAYLDAGLDRVILGTAALEDRGLLAAAAAAHAGRVWVGLDVRDGRLAVRGWLETAAEAPVEAASALAEAGAAGFVVTDIARDGTLAGPSLEQALAVARAVDRPVLASGGVSSADDLRRLAASGRLAGAIVGKALYAGRVTLADALAAVAGLPGACRS